MNDIQQGLLTVLPSKRKTTPSQWVSFNAPCCIHRGESQDTRHRGGVLLNNSTGGFQYHCFNCHFKAGWTPGHLLSKNTKILFKWLGMPDSDISKLNLFALRLKNDSPVEKQKLSFDLEIKNLPENSKSIKEWIEQGCEDPELLRCIEYLLNRGMDFNWYNWYWSDSNGYKDRVIIPFYDRGKIVGWTGRKIQKGLPKYLTEAQPGYVFNLDNQTPDKAFVIVVEGQFDAIAIDGVAVMHNDINETQAARINALGKEVIVVPDRDRAGAPLLKRAAEFDWNASFPLWEPDIKDVADAVKKYGRIYTLLSILEYRETNKLKIQLLAKKLENLNE